MCLTMYVLTTHHVVSAGTWQSQAPSLYSLARDAKAFSHSTDSVSEEARCPFVYVAVVLSSTWQGPDSVPETAK